MKRPNHESPGLRQEPVDHPHHEVVEVLHVAGADGGFDMASADPAVVRNEYIGTASDDIQESKQEFSDGIKRPVPFEGYHFVITAWLLTPNVLIGTERNRPCCTVDWIWERSRAIFALLTKVVGSSTTDKSAID